mgnify:CR=1 FL=1
MTARPKKTPPMSSKDKSENLATLIRFGKSHFRNGGANLPVYLESPQRFPTFLEMTFAIVLLLQIVEVIFHRALVRSRNLILVYRALGFALRGVDGLLILHRALTFDADAFQSNARHRRARTERSAQFIRRKVVRRFAFAALGPVVKIFARRI